jgi:amino acid transporter
MKGLERDLGLPAVLAISIGAMIGSSIFILPSLALEIAGPAVVAAYLLAGLLVLPAALAKSEMATAMPEAGGTYIYIERGMGPLLDTVAGVGTWFSLSFKSALALVGGVPYLVLLLDLPIKPVAIGLAVVLIGVNLLGAKQTGRLQVAIVVIMLGTLGYFAAGSATAVQQDFYRPFFVGGLEGLFAATGLVFVSYAGVTKVASVAEEVENPGRNIPLGILGSLAFTTLLYVAIVAVLVGVTVPGSVAGSLTPVAVAAEVTLGSLGVLAVVVAAVLALVSTANAGLLSSSRYPFAMSRDALAPPSLAEVSERFETPVNAITLTGAVMLALIAFVPILEIAKLASAFQILVFAIVNAAVISFREGSASYEPEFHTPLYPWMPVFGVLTGFALLSQMGLVALAGAGLITLGSLLWYLGYVRPRVSREGVATDALRRQVGRDAVAATVGDDDDSAVREVLVALTRPVTDDRERDLVALAADLVRGDDGRVVVMQFEEIPDQSPLVDPQQTPAEDCSRSG